VVVRFVDIGGIVDHHCLHFIFTKSLEWRLKAQNNISLKC